MDLRLLHGMVGTGLVVGGLHASGALTSGQVYPKPFAVAYAELSATPVPPMVTSILSGSDVYVHRTARSIKWHFTRNGDDVATFTADLTPEDERHTRVKVDFDIGPAMDAQVGRLFATPFMTNGAKLAMAEQVDAELEDRPFDRMRLGRLLAEHYQANPGELQNYSNTIRQMMIDNAALIRANSEGYVETPTSIQPPTDAAVRPSTILPAN